MMTGSMKENMSLKKTQKKLAFQKAVEA